MLIRPRRPVCRFCGGGKPPQEAAAAAGAAPLF
jgi:hypothetical protein